MAERVSSSSLLPWALLFVAAFTLLLLPSPAAAVEYTVGDAIGWTFGYNYSRWTAGKTFYAGDTLVFKYQQGDHNVYAVDEAGYQTCKVPDAPTALNTGKDVVTLEEGTKWFICGIPPHCEQNQKFSVNVLSSGSSGSSGSSPAVPSPSHTSSASGTLSCAVTKWLVVLVAGAMAVSSLFAG